MARRVLLVSPHADDELFGAGGTLLKLKADGCEIKLVLVACSDVHMRHENRVVEATERWDEFTAAAEALSTEEPACYWMPDSRLDSQPQADLVTRLDDELESFRPDLMFMPEPSYHQDHRYVSRACVASLRPTGKWSPAKVLAYEVPTSTWTGTGDRFEPNVFVDINGLIESKVALLRDVYVSQHTQFGRGRLAEEGMVAHARYRGIEAGCEYAEAFLLIREMIR